MSYVAPTPPDDFYRDRNQHHRHGSRHRQPAPMPPKLIRRGSDRHIESGPTRYSESGSVRCSERDRSDMSSMNVSSSLNVSQIGAPSTLSMRPPPPPPPSVPKSSGQEATRTWPVPDNVLDCTVGSCAVVDQETTVDRRKRVASENGMQYEALASVWTGDVADAKAHLFTPEGFPRFLLALEVWKLLIKTYFHWFQIPRSSCTRTWEEIVDNLLKMPQGSVMDVSFQAWAFGCLCKFYLEDRKREIRKDYEEYDPDHPSMLTTI